MLLYAKERLKQRVNIQFCILNESSATRKCALSSALFRRVEVPLVLK